MKPALALLFAVALAATPLSPVWPNVFWQDFKEKTVHAQVGVHLILAFITIIIISQHQELTAVMDNMTVSVALEVHTLTKKPHARIM